MAIITSTWPVSTSLRRTVFSSPPALLAWAERYAGLLGSHCGAGQTGCRVL